MNLRNPKYLQGVAEMSASRSMSGDRCEGGGELSEVSGSRPRGRGQLIHASVQNRPQGVPELVDFDSPATTDLGNIIGKFQEALEVGGT